MKNDRTRSMVTTIVRISRHKRKRKIFLKNMVLQVIHITLIGMVME